jgi:aldehyde:ferredoxin oxidoreductase
MNHESYRRFCGSLKLSKEESDRVCDGPDGFNVGRLTKWAEDYSAAYMSIGFCSRPPIARQLTLKMLSNLYTAATGLDVTPTQLLTSGERIFNVIKSFNVKMGATKRDDVPSRGATWPSDKPLQIAGKDYGTLNYILEQYYDERGWDVKSGVPTKEKLAALGLQSIAEEIGI